MLMFDCKNCVYYRERVEAEEDTREGGSENTTICECTFKKIKLDMPRRSVCGYYIEREC